MTSHILKHEGKALGNLLKKVGQLDEFNHIFAQYIDSNLAAHCRIANLQNNCLIVVVDNGAWATQLRFHIPDLLAQLRQHPGLEQLKSICCKTRPHPDTEKPRKKRHTRQIQRMSKAAALRVLQTATEIKDKKLREALERIVKQLS
jgi:hypothetical protein